MVALGGAFVVAPGGHAWFFPGGHVWFFLGGHAWFFPEGGRVCMVFSGGGGACVGYDEIRSISGRYASYWNAFLLFKIVKYCVQKYLTSAFHPKLYKKKDFSTSPETARKVKTLESV